MHIPNRIFFIWLGKTLPERYLNNIMRFVSSFHPNYELELWVDNSHVFTRALYKSTIFMFGGTRLKLRNINEILALVDDREIKTIVRSELVGSYNYAAASDVLRLLILQKWGGYYFDTDIIHMPNSFDKSAQVLAQKRTSGFLAMMDPPNPGNIPQAVNCAMAAVPEHPILQLALETIKKSYSSLRGQPGFHESSGPLFEVGEGFIPSGLDSKRHKQSQYYRELTIRTSGPAALQRAIMVYCLSSERIRAKLGVTLRKITIDAIDDLAEAYGLNPAVKKAVDRVLLYISKKMRLPVKPQEYGTMNKISAKNRGTLFGEFHNTWLEDRCSGKIKSFEC